MMKIQERRFHFQLLDPTFYETLENYQPEARHYINLAKAYMPEDWRTFAKGIWHHCIAPSRAMPTQGWKIHLSATPYNARAVLLAALPILIEQQTSFKFCVDRHVLFMMTGKNWARGGSGKFITAYPGDEAAFRDLLQRLSAATQEFVGPYILSDKRYGDRGIVYYRYGTMRPIEEISADGTRLTRLLGPDGQSVVDSRPPTFQVPEWLDDPFPNPAAVSEENTLKSGRYLVKSALSFSNAGGVYLATDRERGCDVVIKEARPNVGASWEGDAIALLHKEYRILRKLSAAGVAAAPYDMFREWEHWFLVEEHLTGTTLAKIPPRISLLVQASTAQPLVDRFYGIFRSLFQQIIDAVQRCHDCGIVLGDLSPNNILVSDDFSRIRLIDFEAAVESEVDPPTTFVTAGFVRNGRASAGDGRIRDDYYAVAAMMLSFAFPITQFFKLHGERIKEIIAEVCRDARLPEAVSESIGEIIEGSSEHSNPLEALSATLDDNPWPRSDEPAKQILDMSLLGQRISQIAEFINKNASPSRVDRLYPCDFRAFETNTLSLGHGAYGTVLALTQAGIRVPDEVHGWLLGREISGSRFAPGFVIGLSGFAWAFAGLGRLENAARALDACESHPLFWSSCGLFEGASGWIISCLRMYYETQDAAYLDRAVQCAESVLARAVPEHDGLSWRHSDGKTHLGLGYGASGIALALLYVGAVSGREHLLDGAQRALTFDISHAQRDDHSEALSWGYIADDTSVRLPYYLYGSAGIGTVLLRYQMLTGDRRFNEVLEGVYADTERKYSLGLGKFMGLAGIAGFRFEAFQLTAETRHLDAVAKAVSGIELFAIERDGGVAYPSEMLDRISCDYGYGCAGILALYDRVVNGRADEMSLDRYITGNGVKCRHHYPQSVDLVHR